MESHPFEVHVVDGTYELFRYHFGPSNRDPEFGATRGVLASLLQLLEDGATHVGVATDHVIESFRNDLWPGYKSSAGMPPELLAQFPLVEHVLSAAGFAVWPQVEYEADDGMAAAAALAAADEPGVPGADLHAGQGPRAVRRRPGGAVRPAQGRDLRRGRRAGPARRAAGVGAGSARRWSGTRPTGSRACPAGVRSRRRRC